MDESGLINVYLIVLSFLLSPVKELDFIRFEGEMEAMKLQGKLYLCQLKAVTHHQVRLTSIEMTDIRNSIS